MTIIKSITKQINALTPFVGVVLVAILILFAANVASTWTGPTANPPGNNVDAPINVGTQSQVKNGALGVNSLAVYGNALMSGLSRYLNFGNTSGDTGYGFRDNAGVMEFKNSGSDWTPFGSGGSGGKATSIDPSAAKLILGAASQDLYGRCVANANACGAGYTLSSYVCIDDTNTLQDANYLPPTTYGLGLCVKN